VKFIKSLIAPLLVFSLLSCHRGEKNRLLVGQLPGTAGARSAGTITVGLNGSIFSAPQTFAPNAELRIVIGRIEISQDGNSWISILSSSKTVEIADPIGSYINLSVDPVSVLPGEYHGVRLKINQNAEPIGVSSGITLNPLPHMHAQDTPTSDRGISSEITLTSSQFALTPFRVESGVNTYLVLKISPSINEPEWHLWIKAAATRISP
jgi:hypothetical protein